MCCTILIIPYSDLPYRWDTHPVSTYIWAALFLSSVSSLAANHSMHQGFRVVNLRPARDMVCCPHSVRCISGRCQKSKKRKSVGCACGNKSARDELSVNVCVWWDGGGVPFQYHVFLFVQDWLYLWGTTFQNILKVKYRKTKKFVWGSCLGDRKYFWFKASCQGWWNSCPHNKSSYENTSILVYMEIILREESGLWLCLVAFLFITISCD